MGQAEQGLSAAGAVDVFAVDDLVGWLIGRLADADTDEQARRDALTRLRGLLDETQR